MFIQIFSIFVNVVTPVFFVVFLGYFFGPRLKLDSRTLSRVGYYILIPCFVFDMLSQVNIQLSAAGQMVLYITLTHLLAAITAFSIAKLLGRSKKVIAAFVIVSTFGNVGSLGLSLIDFKLGPDAKTASTIYYITIVMVSFIICVGISNWARGSKMTAVLAVFKTPALIAMIPALFFYTTQYTPPLPMIRITELLARVMIPIMLLTLGVQMSELHSFKFNGDVIIVSCLRLVTAPFIAFSLITFFSLSPIEIRSGILQAGMPAAIFGSIIAIEYKIIPEFVTTTVLFSTLLSLLTLTVLLYLV